MHEHIYFIYFLVNAILCSSALIRQDDNLKELYKFESARMTVTIGNVFPDQLRTKRDVDLNRSLHFRAFGREFQVDLQPAKQFVSEDLLVNVIEKGNISRMYRHVLEECFYQGQLHDQPNSTAVINLCVDGISGFIQDSNGETYHLVPDAEHKEVNKITVVARDADKELPPRKDFCATAVSDELSFNLFPNSTTFSGHRRMRRDADYYSDNSNNFERDWSYVELVMVGDVALFNKYNRSEDAVVKRFLDIVSNVNAMYQPLRIAILLTGVELWTDRDKFPVVHDQDAVLGNFTDYREKELLFRMPNDNAYFITATNFYPNHIIGLAQPGTMCSTHSSGGLVSDHHKFVRLVAATLAHELGHNFGMGHDEDSASCHCPGAGCIMGKRLDLSNDGKVYSSWSNCSTASLEQHLAKGIGACLKSPSSKINKQPQIPSFCGNAILEAGEECDCGGEVLCGNNKCCNATTCKLTTNSTCGHGRCCDLNTCSLKPITTTCREAIGECDLAEYCNGKDPSCPADFWKQYGYNCRNNQAYCFDGVCKFDSYNEQCRYIGEAVASEECFTLNKLGMWNAHCGHNRTFGVAEADLYTKCQAENVKCGLLQCTAQNPELHEGHYGPRGERIACRIINSINVGLTTLDPGMVANGAKCEEGKMCLNQKCMNISLLPNQCQSNCNGNGVCNNAGHCHCHPGFDPVTDCLTKGHGGSVDSGPSGEPVAEDNNSLRDGMLVFFLLVLPVISLALGGYLYRKKIKTWISMKRKSLRSRNSLMKSQSQSTLRLLTISQPNLLTATVSPALAEKSLVASGGRIYRPVSPVKVKTKQPAPAPPLPVQPPVAVKHFVVNGGKQWPASIRNNTIQESVKCVDVNVNIQINCQVNENHHRGEFAGDDDEDSNQMSVSEMKRRFEQVT